MDFFVEDRFRVRVRVTTNQFSESNDVSLLIRVIFRVRFTITRL